MSDTTTPGAPSTPLHKLAAETVGTFVLVALGCGAAVTTGVDLVATGLSFGIAIVVMVYAFGRVSGGHFNPAVTLGAALSGRVAWKEVPLYVGAQLLGAVLGGLALFVLLQGFPGYDSPGPMGQNAFGDTGSGYAWWAAFLLEALLTLVFLYVILAVTDERNEHPALAPLAIGLALSAIHFVAIPATGTSVNPARSIGPALFAGTDAIVQLWLFILAPLVGAAIAGLTYPLLFGRGAEPVPGSGVRFGGRSASAVPGYGAPDQLQQQWNQPGAQPAWGTQTTPMPDQSNQGYPAAGQPGMTGPSSEAGETQVKQNFADQPVIIQDGWQWDYETQQWKPVQQPPR